MTNEEAMSVSTNAIGPGNIEGAGTGSPDKAEPGVPKNKKKLGVIVANLRRKV